MNDTSHREEYKLAIKEVEKAVGREFGNPENPLLFSVRSGAAISMPGMVSLTESNALKLPLRITTTKATGVLTALMVD